MAKNFSYVPVVDATQQMFDDCGQEPETIKKVCNDLIYQFEFQEGNQPDSLSRYKINTEEK